MIPAVTRILFTTDMSENSTVALTHVVGLAKATGAEIRILHVCEALSEDAQVTLTLFIQDKGARKEALTRRVDLARETLAARQEKFWASLSDEFRPVRDQVTSTEVIEGFPAEIILREAARRECDLIVLGAHKHHGLNHTFLGSVAKRVLRRATVPTLVVPNKHET